MTDLFFLFFRGNSPLSKVIQKVTKGPYSHVAYSVGSHYVWGEKMVGPIVIEAWKGWVRMVDCNTSHRPGTPFDVYSVSVPDEVSVAFDTEIVNHLYKRYDFLAIANFLLHRPVADDPDKFFCSELLTYVSYKVGLLPLSDLPYFVSPTGFRDLLLERGKDVCLEGVYHTWRRN